MNGRLTADSRQAEATRRSRAGGRSQPATALLLALALILGACGDDGASGSTTTATNATQAPVTTAPATAAPATTTELSGFPVTVRGTEILEPPTRIVSGSATHTEILYAIGAGEAVVATDAFSNHPAAASETAKFDAFNLNVEAVAAFDPDLVIISFDPGDAVEGLDALGIPTLLFAPPGPTDMEAVYAEWLEVGDATGRSEEAQALVDDTRAEIEEILDMVPETVRAFTYFFELDATLFTAGPGSLVDTILGRIGLQNIVPDDAGAFPQLGPEAVIGADPDYVFLADTAYGESVETVAARPGFDALSAVTNDNVIELDSDIASRWGPRIVELFRVVAKEVYGVG